MTIHKNETQTSFTAKILQKFVCLRSTKSFNRETREDWWSPAVYRVEWKSNNRAECGEKQERRHEQWENLLTHQDWLSAREVVGVGGVRVRSIANRKTGPQEREETNPKL